MSVARRATESTGRFGLFSAKALLEMRGAGRYFSEVLRQAAQLSRGTTPIMVVLMFAIGGSCGLIGNYFLRSLSISDYTGFITANTATRGALPIMFGYVFAAKVGCGIVAEVGSMRIAEELDAFDAVGLDPLRFVVATKLAATWLFTPLIFAAAAVAVSAGAFVTVVLVIGEISQGSFESVHWGLQSLTDYVYSFAIVFVLATLIVLVAAYNGFNVRGGPAEVGAATARSMVVNLVLIHVVFGAMSAAFYGTHSPLPIGGGG